MQFGRERGDRRRRVRDGLFELRGLRGQPLERLALDAHPLAQFLDLALGGENAARLDLAAAGDQMAAAQDVAVERRHRHRNDGCQLTRLLERLDDDRFADRLAQRRGVLAGHARDVGQQHGASWQPRSRPGA